MAEKSLDSQFLTSTTLSVIDQTLSKVTIAVPTDVPQTKELEIVEYEGRMRVSGLEKFNATSVLSVINFYLSEKEMQQHKPKGAMVLYLEVENASKLYKVLGFPVPEDEDDVSMMEACGKFCSLLANDLKIKLADAGYPDLVLSAPDNYKNSAMHGVEFSPDQKIKHEFSFFYWKHRVIVVEVTFADIPKKR